MRRQRSGSKEGGDLSSALVENKATCQTLKSRVQNAEPLSPLLSANRSTIKNETLHIPSDVNLAVMPVARISVARGVREESANGLR